VNESEPGSAAGEGVQPSVAPPATAASIMLLAWGIQTHWLVSLAGAGALALSLVVWINEVRTQWRHET
jgi:hypothetical protein